MSRYDADEVKESVIFDNLLDYLQKMAPFEEYGLYAAVAYDVWQENEFQNYQYYFTIPNDFIPDQNQAVIDGFVHNHIPILDRRSMINLSLIFNLFLIEKYDLKNSLSQMNRWFLNKLIRKARRNDMFRRSLLATSNTMDISNIRMRVNQNDVKELKDLGLNHNFSCHNDTRQQINIDIPWLLQVLDYDEQMSDGDNGFIIAPSAVSENANNQAYHPRSASGFSIFYLYVFELISDTESIVHKTQRIIEGLNEDFGLSGFSDYIGIEQLDITHHAIDLPELAKPAAASATSRAATNHGGGSYFAESPVIDEELISLQNLTNVRYLSNNSDGISFRIDFSPLSLVPEVENMFEGLEWLEHYIIIRDNSEWKRLECISIERPNKLDKEYDANSEQSIDSFFDYSVNIVMTGNSNTIKKVLEKIKNNRSIGMATSIYEDAIYVVLAIDITD